MDVVHWVVNAPEPWTRYRAQQDLLKRTESDDDVRLARAALLDDARVRKLIQYAATWGQNPLKRHNDASHPLHTLGVLADWGLHHTDPGLAPVVDIMLSHQSAEGALCTPLQIPTGYGGTGETEWAWMACDAPVVLRTLLALGMPPDDPRIAAAIAHLIGLVDTNGWRCVVAPSLGKFRGPGRRDDPCPIANIYALAALSHLPDLREHSAAQAGIDMLLHHWEHQTERKLYLFGIGTDYRKVKYPCLWYDLLHVLDVLSRFPQACLDPRFHEMLETLTSQANADGCYTAGSMYRHWKGWSFADKKTPSPWLTLMALRIIKRVHT